MVHGEGNPSLFSKQAKQWINTSILRKHKLYKKESSVPRGGLSPGGGTAPAARHLAAGWRAGDGFHAVLRADEQHGGAPSHHQAQLPGVLCELVLVVRVSHALDGAAQHEAEQRVKPFQDSTGFSASLELH